ncbi:DUF4292 domain-containing protein [Salinimicrobium sp. GXAS 041]|uniref:DUF4292 domain-containing protein n=1 Tax=Salinimicrobium sp. GXAS 041 TaxID=3400806 RepID=UPI003C783BB7
MNKIKIALFISGIILLTSCGSGRTAKMGEAPVEDAAAVEVIKNHYQNEAEFETLQGRLRVHFQNESQNQAVTVSYRMKKDDTIWMSAQLMGFPLAKVLITPNSVQFYEKISGTSFDGDFRLLSDVLGTPLDFQKVQNLLIGQTIYNMRDEPYKLTESSRGYQLQPAAENYLKKMFLLDAGNYKAIAQQITQPGASRGVTITYPEYQNVEGRLFPKEIKIIANEGASNTQIDMEFRSVEFNVPVSFPFTMPSGYDEISIE